ncbi:hypothetical protein IV203_013882 [Nitzschia inconspicua]|uniref:Immune mapped protein 2 N-terminal domain-containing protein n=1 Tax=Nitzschia inconspicua TaxID=303405 RepID=A0A9K3Q7S7_9STRA|nr:hypothetical protein IV203_013882 [Nitzschia inconspicua]
MRWIPQDNSATTTWRPKPSSGSFVVKENTVPANENVNTLNNMMKSQVLNDKKAVFGEKKPVAVLPKMQKGLSYRSLSEPVPEGGACNLVYEPDSSGRLVEHYSTQPLEGVAAVGRWTAGTSKKIAPFKFKRNAGRNVLIGNCSAGVQGRKNYCSGWCQFVKSAKIQQGDVTVYDVPSGLKAMPVDVYLYYNDSRPGYQSVKLIPGKPQTTDNLLAVACIPQNTQFYENMTVDLLKWLQDGNNHGYSTKL